MDRTLFGRTGLEVSVLGLGSGGYSRLGTAQGASDDEAVKVVRRALDLGVNLFDSAEGYGTEPIFGKALEDVDRADVVLCTKAGIGERSPGEFEEAIHQSLRNLQTNYVDVYQIHGLRAADYRRAVDDFLPVLDRAREQGKIRFVGVTEGFGGDTGHVMLSMAVRDDAWDTMMVGCNMLNFCAAERLFPTTIKKKIGVLDMFAVRYALAGPDNLKASIQSMVSEGHLEPEQVDPDLLLEMLLDECTSVPEAAYRFCRHLPGVDCVLSGTGSVAHLEANVRAANKPPLSEKVVTRIRKLFGGIDSVSGKTPSGPW